MEKLYKELDNGQHQTIFAAWKYYLTMYNKTDNIDNFKSFMYEFFPKTAKEFEKQENTYCVIMEGNDKMTICYKESFSDAFNMFCEYKDRWDIDTTLSEYEHSNINDTTKFTVVLTNKGEKKSW